MSYLFEVQNILVLRGMFTFIGLENWGYLNLKNASVMTWLWQTSFANIVYLTFSEIVTNFI